MSWYDDAYTFRTLVRVAPHATDLTTALVIPADWDEFWTQIQSTGYDIRFASVDGITLNDHERISFNTTTRYGEFRINRQPNATDHAVVWMYWGYAAATDASTSVSAPGSGTTKGSIFLGAQSRTNVDLVPEAAGSTQPAVLLSKMPQESIFVWFRIDGGDLIRRRTTYQGSDRLEELTYAGAVCYLADGTAAGGAINANVFAMYEDPQGAAFILIQVTDGTTNTDYLVECVAQTAVNSAQTSTYRKRVGVQVRAVTLS